MGLDMYLNAKRYVSSNDLFDKADPEIYKSVKELSGAGSFPESSYPHAEIEIAVGYWRKANAIHKWFVDNVQNGEDECRPHYVSREHLQTLLVTVDEVLTTRNTDLLPVFTEGFFFGSYEIDDYYWEYLEDTKATLTNILSNIAEDSRWEFQYRSSW